MKIMDSDRQKFSKAADSQIGAESQKLDNISKENARLAQEVHAASCPRSCGPVLGSLADGGGRTALCGSREGRSGFA